MYFPELQPLVKNCHFGVSPVIIIIIIISIFKKDNVFSITASLPYGPLVNTDIDYYRTFFGLVNFCKGCEVSCAIFC